VNVDGQVIRSGLDEPALARHVAARFFTGHGAHTGSMWRSYAATLAPAVARRSAVEGGIEGALATFESLREWLADR
jgi:heme oxygenase